MDFFAVLYRSHSPEEELFMLVIGLVIACIYAAYQSLRKFFKRLKANGWKYVPLPKWRGNYEEVYAYLADNGMEDVTYSHNEGISGYALDAVKSLDDIAVGRSIHGAYVSGIYRGYPVWLSKVYLEHIDSKENTEGSIKGAVTGRESYYAMGHHIYFSGEWYIFNVKRNRQAGADLFIVDQRLIEEDGRHGPGRYTQYKKRRLNSPIDGRYNIFLSDSNYGEVTDYLDEQTQALLMHLWEQYKLLVCVVGSKVHIGVAGQKQNFFHQHSESVEEWRAKQTLFAQLDDLLTLVERIGGQPSKDDIFF